MSNYAKEDVKMVEITFDGTESSILKLIEHLPDGRRWVKRDGNSITIPTLDGAKQVFKGDMVVVDGLHISIKD